LNANSQHKQGQQVEKQVAFFS